MPQFPGGRSESYDSPLKKTLKNVENRERQTLPSIHAKTSDWCNEGLPISISFQLSTCSCNSPALKCPGSRKSKSPTSLRASPRETFRTVDLKWEFAVTSLLTGTGFPRQSTHRRHRRFVPTWTTLESNSMSLSHAQPKALIHPWKGNKRKKKEMRTCGDETQSQQRDDSFDPV